MVRIHIAEFLAKKKWNQMDLSRATGIRYNTINDLYHEIALGIKFKHLELICNALRCSPNQLIEIIPPKKK